MYDHYFSNFGSPPIPDICKDSAIRYTRFWRRFLKIFPIGKQTWPCCKKVKRQCTTILLATLVDLLSLMILAKIQPQGMLGWRRFLMVFIIWAWRPPWSTDRNHFSNLSFPHPKEAPYEIWAKLALRLQRSRLKMLTNRRTDEQTDKKWSQ